MCEHASSHIPDEFQDLGLSAVDQGRHIAWDPGALETAKQMAIRLDAALIHSTVSRLIYDCNRPPEAEDAIPAISEETKIPGNVGLSDQDKKARLDRFYRPFARRLSQLVDARSETVLVTIHSFTPNYRGQARSVEIGILHDDDTRLADALLEVARGYNTQRNAPYGPEDGVLHTLRLHALPHGHLNVMIEIRNDLIATSEQCAKMAATLADWVSAALKRVQPAAVKETSG
ncbi:MAG: N-formylglutamate amidohydrolase [Pseudomonadota bacterium]